MEEKGDEEDTGGEDVSIVRRFFLDDAEDGNDFLLGGEEGVESSIA